MLSAAGGAASRLENGLCVAIRAGDGDGRRDGSGAGNEVDAGPADGKPILVECPHHQRQGDAIGQQRLIVAVLQTRILLSRRWWPSLRFTSRNANRSRVLPPPLKT